MRLAGGLGGALGRGRGSERARWGWRCEELMVLYYGIIIIYRQGVIWVSNRTKQSHQRHHSPTSPNIAKQINAHVLSSHCLVASNSASPCAFALPP